MKHSSDWRWCVAGNLRDAKSKTLYSLRPASAPPLKHVFIGRDYDPVSGEVTVAWLNIKGETAVIARIPLQRLSRIRVMKTRNSWGLQMMSDLATDGLWWGSSVADMNDAEAYRNMLQAEIRLQETAAPEQKVLLSR